MSGFERSAIRSLTITRAVYLNSSVVINNEACRVAAGHLQCAIHNLLTHRRCLFNSWLAQLLIPPQQPSPIKPRL